MANKIQKRVAREKRNTTQWHGLLKLLPAISIMIFIFIHSAMPADMPRVESGWFVDFVKTFLPFDVAPDHLTFLIRKTAHFTEYLLLGLTLAWGINSRKCAALIGISYAILDEIHQAFVLGRSCEIRDVCIDVAGVLVGMVVLRILYAKGWSEL